MLDNLTQNQIVLHCAIACFHSHKINKWFDVAHVIAIYLPVIHTTHRPFTPKNLLYIWVISTFTIANNKHLRHLHRPKLQRTIISSEMNESCAIFHMYQGKMLQCYVNALFKRTQSYSKCFMCDGNHSGETNIAWHST